MSPSKLFVEACRKIAENKKMKNHKNLELSLFLLKIICSKKMKSYFFPKCHHRNFLFKCVVKFQHFLFG